MIDFALPAGNRRGPNCGITAIAIAAGVSFQHVWQVVGQKKPANWQGSVYREDIVRAFRRLGVRYSSRPYGLRITVREFAGKAKPGVLYVIDTADHIAVFKDGLILDQRGRYFTLDQKGHWKVERVYEVRGNAANPPTSQGIPNG